MPMLQEVVHIQCSNYCHGHHHHRGGEKHTDNPEERAEDDRRQDAEHWRQLDCPFLNHWHQQVPFDLLNADAQQSHVERSLRSFHECKQDSQQPACNGTEKWNERQQSGDNAHGKRQRYTERPQP